MASKSVTVADDRVDSALAALYAAAGNLQPAQKNIGEYGVSSTKQRFIEEKDPEGNPWKDLNPLYLKTKKGSGKLKGETGSLAQIVYQLDDEGVEWGSNEIYARIHNEGGDIVPKNAAALVFSMGGQTFHVQKVTIPRRQFLGTNQVDIDRILEIVQDHFMEALPSENETP